MNNLQEQPTSQSSYSNWYDLAQGALTLELEDLGIEIEFDNAEIKKLPDTTFKRPLITWYDRAQSSHQDLADASLKVNENNIVGDAVVFFEDFGDLGPCEVEMHDITVTQL